MAAEQMQQIAVRGLVLDGVVAERGGQALAWSGARYMLFTVIVEQIAGVQRALGAQNTGELSKELVVVVNLQDRAQSLGLQSQQLLDLVNAGRAWAEAARIVRAMQNEGR